MEISASDRELIAVMRQYFTTKAELESLKEHLEAARQAAGEAIGVLDLASAEGFQDRMSVQALGLRTVWCLAAGDGALLYLDTTAMPETDPALALGGLEALVRHARPLLPP